MKPPARPWSAIVLTALSLVGMLIPTWPTITAIDYGRRFLTVYSSWHDLYLPFGAGRLGVPLAFWLTVLAFIMMLWNASRRVLSRLLGMVLVLIVVHVVLYADVSWNLIPAAMLAAAWRLVRRSADPAFADGDSAERA